MKTRFPLRRLSATALGLLLLLVAPAAHASGPVSPTAPAAPDTPAVEAARPVAPPPAPSRAEQWRAEAERAAPDMDLVDVGETSGNISRLGQGLLVRGDVHGSVNLVRGDLYVLGRVRGPVSVVSGRVTVLGEVDGRVSVVGGDLRIAGRVRGETSVVGGRIQRVSVASTPPSPDSATPAPPPSPGHPAPPKPPAPPNAHSSESITFNWNPDWMEGDWPHKNWAQRNEWLVVGLLFGGVLWVCWLATSLFTTVLFPQAVIRAADLLSAQPAKVFAVGIAFWVAFVLALGVAVLLSGLIIGVPLVGALLLLALGLRWFGLAAVFLWIGRGIGRRLGRVESPYLAVFIGVGVTALLHMIPILGFVLWGLLAIPVAGVASLAFAERRRPAAPLDAQTYAA